MEEREVRYFIHCDTINEIGINIIVAEVNRRCNNTISVNSFKHMMYISSNNYVLFGENVSGSDLTHCGDVQHLYSSKYTKFIVHSKKLIGGTLV